MKVKSCREIDSKTTGHAGLAPLSAMLVVGLDPNADEVVDELITALAAGSQSAVIDPHWTSVNYQLAYQLVVAYHSAAVHYQLENQPSQRV